MRVHVVVVGTQFNPRDIAEADDTAVLVGRNDYVFKIPDVVKQPLSGQRQNQRRISVARRGADLADRCLNILRGNSVDDIRTAQAQRRKPVAVEPNAHAVLRSVDGNVTDTVNTGQRILNVGIGEVAEVKVIIGVVRRTQHQQAQNVGHLGLDVNAFLLHQCRQLRHNLRQTVLNLNLRNIRIGADIKGNGQTV